MPRTIALKDINGDMQVYKVATLYFDRLSSTDENFVPSEDGSTFVKKRTSNIPGVVYYNDENVRAQDQNLDYYTFAQGGMSPLPAVSDQLNNSIADVIKPDDDISTRIVDFVDFNTGERLHAGDNYSRCFSSGESYSQPPADITTSKSYWKRYQSGGKWYYERTNQWNSPSDVFYRNYSLVNYLTYTQYGDNIFGCSMYVSGSYVWVHTGFDPKNLAGNSWASENIDLGAYVTNGQPKGVPGSIDPEDEGYSNQYSQWYGILSTFPDPGGSYDIVREDVDNFIQSVGNPYNYEGVATEEAKILDEVSVQFVYTEIDGKSYIGLMMLLFNEDNEVIAMNGTFYPSWVFGGTTGEGGDPDEPDPGEEDYGPDAEGDNEEGDYNITQSPPGAISGETGWLPYSRTTTADGGIHVWVVDDRTMDAVFSDFWGSRFDVEKLKSGIIRFGMIPGTFLPIASGESTAVDGITYASYGVRVPADGSAWLVNNHIIVSKTNAALFTTSNGLNRVYGNYLDFEPYTNIVLHVPFCGSIDIPPSKCIGGTITVDYKVNVENGDIVARVHCVSGNNVTTKKGRLGNVLETDYYLYGNCFVELPLAATVDTTLLTMTKLSAGVSGMVSGALLYPINPIGVYAATAEGIKQLVEMKESTRPGVSNAGGTINRNIFEPKKFYLDITRPAELADGDYKKISGTQSFRVKTLKDIKGFTQCLQVLRTTLSTTDETTTNVQELKFSGTPSELSEIKRVLQEGVVL